MTEYHPFDESWQQDLSSQDLQRRKEILKDAADFGAAKLSPESNGLAVDKMVLIKDRFPGEDFTVAKILHLREGGSVVVQWYGSLSADIEGPQYPGWKVTAKNKVEWTKRKPAGSVPYTNRISVNRSNNPISVTKDHISLSGIKLRSDSTLPTSVIDMIEYSL